MKEGMQHLENLTKDVKEKIVTNYGSLEEFYFEVWYNRHSHYKAFKEKNEEECSRLDSELNDFEDLLESFGEDLGSDIIQHISDDHGEFVATNFVNKKLGEIGWEKSSIKEFIAEYLGKD